MRLPWDDDSEIVETPSMQEQIKQLTESQYIEIDSCSVE